MFLPLPFPPAVSAALVLLFSLGTLPEFIAGTLAEVRENLGALPLMALLWAIAGLMLGGAAATLQAVLA